MRIAFVVLIAALAIAGCYKGDPGYGGDYPPEPPFVSVPARDAGRE